MKLEVGMFRKSFLITIFILIVAVVSPSVSYAQIVYSHLFENGVAYQPGSPQFDEWLSFRESLPPAGVSSITVSGSRDPGGRTCSDPVIAQQIVDAMRAGAAEVSNFVLTLSVSCDGFIWNTGACSDIGPAPNNLELNVGSDTLVCDCHSLNYTLRPGVTGGVSPNPGWGGTNGTSCDPPTQIMTVTVELIPRLIPTLSEWGLIVMAGILGIVGFMVMRRKKVTA